MFPWDFVVGCRGERLEDHGSKVFLAGFNKFRVRLLDFWFSSQLSANETPLESG